MRPNGQLNKLDRNQVLFPMMVSMRLCKRRTMREARARVLMTLPLSAHHLFKVEGSITLLLMSLTDEIGTSSWTVWAQSVKRNWAQYYTALSACKPA
ncbi:MAG: hypothetical protein FRX49_08705 [Trebouxia sp. A1-2]|nr:MAG: hypothetical protein FRX49_08705 [Trebouxia sp. A1-2]